MRCLKGCPEFPQRAERGLQGQRVQDALRQDQRHQAGRSSPLERVRLRLFRFQNFILPNQNPRLRYFTMRRPVIIPVPHEKLTQKIEWITAKFLSEIVSQYSKYIVLDSDSWSCIKPYSVHSISTPHISSPSSAPMANPSLARTLNALSLRSRWKSPRKKWDAFSE